MLAPGRGLRSADLADIVRRDAGWRGRAAAGRCRPTFATARVDRKLHLALELDEQGRSKRIGEARWRRDDAGRTWRAGARHLADAIDGSRLRRARRRPAPLLRPPGARALSSARRGRRRLREGDAPAQCAAGAGQGRSCLARRAGAAHGGGGRGDGGASRRRAEAHAGGDRGAARRRVSEGGARPRRRFEKHAAEGAEVARIEQEIASALRQNRTRDQVAGRTLEGVHRTDLTVVHAPKQLPADQCSTGEQKALLIGLILANAQALFERDFAPSPLLLLDEAAAHLDSDRRAALYDELAALGGQAWLTGTDRSLFDAFGDRAQRFEVSDGHRAGRLSGF